MRRIGVVLCLALVLVVSMHWVGQASQTPAQGAPGANAPRFTGKSTVMEGKELTAARRHFEAGARTFWHSHDKGQLLLVEEGRMRTQKRGEAVRELGVGQSEYAGPNVAHWHGATAGQTLVQINVGFGGGTKWLEEVTDAEYNKK
jgi:quercetin dioxygenase-like cupin family protein